MHYRIKSMVKGAVGRWRDWVYNLMYFAGRSQEANDLAMLRNLVLSLPSEVKERYADECSYVESLSPDELGRMVFPYPASGEKADAECVGGGVEKGCPYVLHNGTRKLFFPCRENDYAALVYREGLLGTGRLTKSPHRYQDGDFKIERGDVLLDVGCAEAVFALDNIDKVSKAYLFESESAWRKPLRLTFAPYADKVVLVDRQVSDRTTRKTTRLLDAVAPDMTEAARFFVKMDIEGWERTVIRGNADFFKTAKVKLSCCVYHRQDDAKVIEAMLREMGYTTRFSDGYMLPTMNGVHYPYFRHGVIYARNY